jgi:hypothetical protein
VVGPGFCPVITALGAATAVKFARFDFGLEVAFRPTAEKNGLKKVLNTASSERMAASFINPLTPCAAY